LQSGQDRDALPVLLRCNIDTGYRVNAAYLLTIKFDPWPLERMRDMSDFTHDGPALLVQPATGTASFAGAAKQAWAWLAAPVRAFFQRELVMRELTALDERSLHDIGLTRSDLPAVSRGLYRRGGLAQRKLDPAK
jgi:uncharacterized protein YjiS (DUF1127 family)